MGKLKAKKSKSKKSKGSFGGVVSRTAGTMSSLGSRIASTVTGGGARTGGRRSRETPEKLARKILILKLKKRLYKLKYGGR